MAPLLCLLGRHKWDGCRCARSGCLERRDSGHKWNGCECEVCKAVRDLHHSYNACGICERCGNAENASHNWQRLSCERCNKFRYPEAVKLVAKGEVTTIAVLSDLANKECDALGIPNENTVAVEFACASIGTTAEEADWEYQAGPGSHFGITAWGNRRVLLVRIKSSSGAGAVLSGPVKSDGFTESLPCFRCGEQVSVLPGSRMNSIYWPTNGKSYAQHAGGCRGEGTPDSAVDWARLSTLTDERRKASEIPC